MLRINPFFLKSCVDYVVVLFVAICKECAHSKNAPNALVITISHPQISPVKIKTTHLRPQKLHFYAYLMTLRGFLAVCLLSYHVHANRRRHQRLSAQDVLHHKLVHQFGANLEEQQGL